MTVRTSSNFNHVSDFAVTIHNNDDETESEVQVARIDTAHGVTHFDKLFRPDEPKASFDGTICDAIDRLTDNWRRYAESYENNR
ncbi:DUF7718 family protein [Haladaptatus cibarius]|uniref:DUF7718 family protein n=1 Tax=Haladaptatus cibarius TaxID=453847 RepID=UPI0006790092|nr:hypothetical protein [Haladaptatus cibarius]